MRVITKWTSVLFVSAIMQTAASAAVNDSAVKVKWGYKGAINPTHWADLDPAFKLCATGKEQSPINISTKNKLVTSPTFSVHYEPATLGVIDDGTTNVHIGSEDFVIADGHGVQLNVPLDRQAKETLIYNGKRYHLLQFHFHTPSENQLKGAAAAAEIHFVNQGENGAVAVLGVFVKVGEANPVLQAIIDRLPKEEGKEATMKAPLDISRLVESKGGAYQFAGSLTTPPCTEGLAWLVMVDTITASSEQIVKLRKAANGANARPVQSLNKRTIAVVAAEKA